MGTEVLREVVGDRVSQILNGLELGEGEREKRGEVKERGAGRAGERGRAGEGRRGEGGWKGGRKKREGRGGGREKWRAMTGRSPQDFLGVGTGSSLGYWRYIDLYFIQR